MSDSPPSVGRVLLLMDARMASGELTFSDRDGSASAGRETAVLDAAELGMIASPGETAVHRPVEGIRAGPF